MNIFKSAYSLMEKHGLHGWFFCLHDDYHLDDDNIVIGQCNYEFRRITLDRNAARFLSDGDVESILLHEIAHALVGPNHDHDEIWQQVATEIGSKHVYARHEGEHEYAPVERETDNIHILDILKYFKSIDELTYHLDLRYGHHGTTQQFWYNEYLNLTKN